MKFKADMSCPYCGKEFMRNGSRSSIARDGEVFEIHNCHTGKNDKVDNINKPNHYQGTNGLEVFDVFEEFAPCPEYVEGAYWSNVVKYILRFHKKNGVEDLKKAQVYLGKLIEHLEDKR